MLDVVPRSRGSVAELILTLVLGVPAAAVIWLYVVLAAGDVAEKEGLSADDGQAGTLILAATILVALAAYAGLAWLCVRWWRVGRTNVWGLPLVIAVGGAVVPLLLLLFSRRVRAAVLPQRQPSVRDA